MEWIFSCRNDNNIWFVVQFGQVPEMLLLLLSCRKLQSLWSRGREHR
jgi:hypothetical protein